MAANADKREVAVLVGPVGAGKSQLCKELSEQGESIISGINFEAGVTKQFKEYKLKQKFKDLLELDIPFVDSPGNEFQYMTPKKWLQLGRKFFTENNMEVLCFLVFMNINDNRRKDELMLTLVTINKAFPKAEVVFVGSFSDKAEPYQVQIWEEHVRGLHNTYFHDRKAPLNLFKVWGEPRPLDGPGRQFECVPGKNNYKSFMSYLNPIFQNAKAVKMKEIEDAALIELNKKLAEKHYDVDMTPQTITVTKNPGWVDALEDVGKGIVRGGADVLSLGLMEKYHYQKDKYDEDGNWITTDDSPVDFETNDNGVDW